MAIRLQCCMGAVVLGWMFVASSLKAQNSTPDEPALPKLMVGSKAPGLLVEKWLKGDPVESFVEGQVYLVDFWSTGCFPCIESIPHLSELQARYQEKLIVIGVSIREGGEDNREYGEETTRRVQDFLTNLVTKQTSDSRLMVLNAYVT